MKSPKTGGSDRTTPGARPKNWFSGSAAVSSAPFEALRTRMAVLIVSTTKPLPTHSPWSGGSRLNWVSVKAPVPAVRWSKWFRPAKCVVPVESTTFCVFGVGAIVGTGAGPPPPWTWPPLASSGSGPSSPARPVPENDDSLPPTIWVVPPVVSLNSV